MPVSSSDPSPFVVRDDGPSGAAAASGETASPTQHRHNIGGQPVAIDDSSDEESSSDEERDGTNSPLKKSTNREAGAGTGESRSTGWPTITNMNGINVSEPPAHDKLMYTRYSEISSLSAPRRQSKVSRGSNYSVKWECVSKFSLDSTRQVTTPVVSKESKNLYEDYCKISKFGPGQPSDDDAFIYRSYIRQNYL